MELSEPKQAVDSHVDGSIPSVIKLDEPSTSVVSEQDRLNDAKIENKVPTVAETGDIVPESVTKPPEDDINLSKSAEDLDGVDVEIDNIDEGFVMLEKDESFKYDEHRTSFFSQMETILALQVEKCNYYKKVFEQQDNVTMAARFETYSQSTASSLELLKMSLRNNDILPRYRFETISLSCLPVNIDIKERELQIVVKTSNLPVEKNTQVYIIAEFVFPQPRAETMTGSIERWIHSVRIEPKNILFCSENRERQLDIVYSTNSVPFNDPESKFTEYSRALTFFVDKGKSRTLKRKFNPVKLTFYEKRGFLKCDKRLGFVQVRVEGINDENVLKSRQPIMDGRKQTDAVAEIKVRVREPLVDKSIRAHEDKLLILT